MKAVSGFLADDGAFFESSEDCLNHEQRHHRLSELMQRCRQLVEHARTGEILKLPECAASLINFDDSEFIDIWNEVLVPLLIRDGESLFGDASQNSGDAEALEARLIAVQGIINYLLGNR